MCPDERTWTRQPAVEPTLRGVGDDAPRERVEDGAMKRPIAPDPEREHGRDGAKGGAYRQHGSNREALTSIDGHRIQSNRQGGCANAAQSPAGPEWADSAPRMPCIRGGLRRMALA